MENETSIVSWFYSVLKNALIDYYRSQASEASKYDAYFNELVSAGSHQTGAPDEIKAVVCACLYRLLPTLKPNYAEVRRRIDLESNSVQQVAHELNINAGNLTVRLHRARAALKISLERSCGACTEHGCLDCTCE